MFNTEIIYHYFNSAIIYFFVFLYQEQDNWILLIAGSGCLGMIVFVSVTVLVIRKRRQSCAMR